MTTLARRVARLQDERERHDVEREAREVAIEYGLSATETARAIAGARQRRLWVKRLSAAGLTTRAILELYADEMGVSVEEVERDCRAVIEARERRQKERQG